MLRLSLAVLLFAQAGPALAATCPPIIGELATGSYRSYRGSYRCFSSVREAQRAGFIPGPPLVANTAPFNFAGTSDQTSGVFTVSKPAVFSYYYDGKDYFAVRLRHAADGSYADLLASHIGSANGTVGIRPGTYYIDVSGVGNWSVSVSPR